MSACAPQLVDAAPATYEESGLLLYAVAAVAVEPAQEPGWFRRCAHAGAAVISREEDVPDVLLRLPDCWNIADTARCHGLHDDPDIVAADPRFRHGDDDTAFAIVAHDDGLRHVLLMQVNAAEAVLMPERPFRERDGFERCVWG
ncbi:MULTISPECIES: hypothetical protein [unclassified Paraburkholderia]|uniref:hypothetical protein n=1 Tax=unclassified Paraburkholderia TaxID=2615204 RepID=UPI0019825DEC|nr:MULTISPECIES: hypothetical protein [unclassified Paraburkholderia]MBN3858635.1 hypothetical protein [Paraburkholderia sp. Ac-20340]